MNPQVDTTELQIEPAAGDVKVLESYPLERYDELRDGILGVDEFVDDLIRHVERSLARGGLL